MEKNIVLTLCGMLIGACAEAQTLSGIEGNIIHVDERPSLYGCLFASSDWKNIDDRNKNTGIYHFYGGKELSLTPVAIGADFAAETGFYMNGKFIFQRPRIEDNFIIGYELCEADVKNWEQTRNPLFFEEDSIFSSDFAYDHTSGDVFGFFKHKNFEMATEFSRFDLNTGLPGLIKSVQVPFVCVAANLKGELYGVDMRGILNKIDKETGDLTEIGFTGLSPKYSQSADFDFRTGKMYWYASTKNQEMGLYEIDLTTGKATLVSDIQQNQITAVFIKNPELKAPAMIEQALCVPKEKGSPEVRFSFNLPLNAVDGSALSGKLEVKIMAEPGNILAERTECSPGETVGFDLRLPPGMMAVTAVVSNHAGEGMYAPFIAWIGEDIPSAPKDIVISEKDGKAEISWSADEVGQNGGYVNLEGVTYNIVRNDGTVFEGIKDCSFVDESIAEKTGTYVYYTVYAKSESGISAPAISNARLLGTPLPFPYKETFNDRQNFSDWTEENENHSVSAWSWSEKGENPDTGGFDKEKGLISFNAYSGDVPKGTVSRLISPTIDLTGMSSGFLGFAVYHYTGRFQTDDCIDVEIVTKDGTFHQTGNRIMRISDTEGWQIYNIPIDDFCGGEVAVSFAGMSDFGYNIHIDHIQVSDKQLAHINIPHMEYCEFTVRDNILYGPGQKKDIILSDINGICIYSGILPADGIHLKSGLYILSSDTGHHKIMVP